MFEILAALGLIVIPYAIIKITIWAVRALFYIDEIRGLLIEIRDNTQIYHNASRQAPAAKNANESCEICGKKYAVAELARLDSGQWVCGICRNEMGKS